MRRLVLLLALLAAPVAFAAVHDQASVPLLPSGAIAVDLDRDKDADVAVVGRCRGKRTTCLAGIENVRRKLRKVRTVELRGFSLARASVAPTGNGLVIAGNGAGPDIAILRSQGAGAFAIAQRFDVRSGVTDVATGDVNGDGRIDIVTVGPGGLGVFPGNPGGLFGTPAFTGTPFVPTDVTVQRLDGDRFADVVFAGGNDLGIVESGPKPIFGAPHVYEVRGVVADLDAIDFGADGAPDLAVATSRGIQVFSTGPDPSGGVDLTAGPFLAGTRPVGVVVADVNRDNLVDIIALNAGSGNLSTSIASAGGGYGTPVRSVPIGANPIAIGAINFNNDGIPDVVVANVAASGPGTLSVLLGDGRGNFRLGGASSPPPPTGTIPLDFGLTYNHPSPNQGFSWVCADVTAASGALLNLTLSPPSGADVSGTLQLQRKATPTARGKFSFKILSYGTHQVRVIARANGKTATKTKTIDVTGAPGSDACGP
jgi:hypothetical protein